MNKDINDIISDYFDNGKLRPLIRDNFKQLMDKKEESFANTNFFHALESTDYILNNVQHRLCIVSKGFIDLYKAFKDDIQKAINRIRDNDGEINVIITKKYEETAKFFLEAEVLEEEMHDYNKEGPDSTKNINPIIVADNNVRISKPSGKELKDIIPGDIRADVYLNYKKLADIVLSEISALSGVSFKNIK